MPTTYAIPNSAKFMDATIYAGNSVNATTITNSQVFYPDFVWIKNRGSGTAYHILADSNRGGGKSLYSNSTLPEGTNDGSGYVSAFGSSGFTLTGGSSGYGDVNATGNNYVAWQWKAGAGVTSNNTTGTITSTVTANTTAGFSIVKYSGNGSSGSTLGHGLGVAPSMIFFKIRNLNGYNWICYHSSLGATKAIYLSATNAAESNTYLNNTNPSSSVITLGSNSNNNDASGTYVAYCWSEIAGFSKFGSYTGNGNADGPFVYTGFRPKFVLYKRTDVGSTEDWRIMDTTRDPYNLAVYRLAPNTSAAESSSVGFNNLDFLSNGFKVRSNSTDQNANGGAYIYAAFAETPFKYANAR